jgi:hypothetical protein
VSEISDDLTQKVKAIRTEATSGQNENDYVRDEISRNIS